MRKILAVLALAFVLAFSFGALTTAPAEAAPGPCFYKCVCPGVPVFCCPNASGGISCKPAPNGPIQCPQVAC
jgi:hypothetical protein